VHRILKEVLRDSAEGREGEVLIGISGGHGLSHAEDAPTSGGASESGSQLAEGARPEIDLRSSRGAAAEDSPGRKFGVGRAARDESLQGRHRSGTDSMALKAPGAGRPRDSRQDPSTALRAGSGATASPWSKRRDHAEHRHTLEPTGGPIPLEELHDIAEESSQAERRADEAERELMEWKKVKFMQERVGEDFDGLIISVTKFGFFVELTDLFVEGLVPLSTLIDDRYTYHENTREIIGQRGRRIYRLGQKIRVIVDRIDPVEKKIQFAVLEPEEQPTRKRAGKR
jgi:predicted RNA-binding protein with RPS1 domain